MRSKIVAGIFLIIVIGAVLIGIGINKWEGEKEADNSTRTVLEVPTTSLRSPVMKDIIPCSLTVKGVADSYMDKSYYEITEITFENTKERDSFYCNYVAGKEINKDEVLYSFNSKDYTVNYDGRVVDVEKNDNGAVITAINYDKIYIKCLAQYENIDEYKIGNGISLQIDYGNMLSEAFEGEIVGIGSIVENNQVDLYIKSDMKLLPGVNVLGKYSYEKNVETMYVLKDMILSDGIDKYVQLIEEKGEITKVVVETGEEFIIQNDGVVTEFVEIFGELSEGDKLIVDKLME